MTSTAETLMERSDRLMAELEALFLSKSVVPRRLTRGETINSVTSFRVTVHDPEGVCTHSSVFHLWQAAADYYRALALPGVKTLSMRAAGRHRFALLLKETLP